MYQQIITCYRKYSIDEHLSDLVSFLQEHYLKETLFNLAGLWTWYTDVSVTKFGRMGCVSVCSHAYLSLSLPPIMCVMWRVKFHCAGCIIQRTYSILEMWPHYCYMWDTPIKTGNPRLYSNCRKPYWEYPPIRTHDIAILCNKHMSFMSWREICKTENPPQFTPQFTPDSWYSALFWNSAILEWCPNA